MHAQDKSLLADFEHFDEDFELASSSIPHLFLSRFRRSKKRLLDFLASTPPLPSPLATTFRAPHTKTTHTNPHLAFGASVVATSSFYKREEQKERKAGTSKSFLLGREVRDSASLCHHSPTHSLHSSVFPPLLCPIDKILDSVGEGQGSNSWLLAILWAAEVPPPHSRTRHDT